MVEALRVDEQSSRREQWTIEAYLDSSRSRQGRGVGLWYIMYSVYFIVLDEDTVLECAGWGLGSATHRAAYRHSFPRRGSWGRRAWGWASVEVQRDGGHAEGAGT